MSSYRSTPSVPFMVQPRGRLLLVAAPVCRLIGQPCVREVTLREGTYLDSPKWSLAQVRARIGRAARSLMTETERRIGVDADARLQEAFGRRGILQPAALEQLDWPQL